ncbi:TlpA disulfide reductase family protein [Flavobacterium lacus]|uniref:Thiol-disulfide isomerase/thioredoxin n=1 Tax=Flavobacterium lacus TaxID=1353778 RepID=A0A328WJB2_9FLAO|nr:TlpA disulfide reductase family protein [Flavobacterium lacus]RAR46311.1 thiol-disulfide isomerase/thioredoxin [Flavobacterium lacus]
MHQNIKLILLLVFHFFWVLNGFSQSKTLSKPLKVYEIDGIKLKSFNFDGLQPYLNQKNDTVYVINFWATWCVPCVKELPHFEKLNQKYKGGKFKMILVSLDFPKMIESRVIPFIKNKNLQAEVVVLNDPDANTWIEKVAKEWSGAIPATIIYKNEKRRFYEQSFTEEELETEIKSFIN